LEKNIQALKAECERRVKVAGLTPRTTRPPTV